MIIQSHQTFKKFFPNFVCFLLMTHQMTRSKTFMTFLDALKTTMLNKPWEFCIKNDFIKCSAQKMMSFELQYSHKLCELRGKTYHEDSR